MRMTFDYILPQIAAQNETLLVSERGTLDLEDGTLNFCIGDVSYLKGRVIPVEGFLYRIARVEFYKSEERGGNDSVGLLHLEDTDEESEKKSSKWSMFDIAFLAVIALLLYFAFIH